MGGTEPVLVSKNQSQSGDFSGGPIRVGRISSLLNIQVGFISFTCCHVLSIVIYGLCLLGGVQTQTSLWFYMVYPEPSDCVDIPQRPYMVSADGD